MVEKITHNLFERDNSDFSSSEESLSDEKYNKLIKTVKKSREISSKAKILSVPKIRSEFNVSVGNKITMSDLVDEIQDDSLKKKITVIGEQFQGERLDKPEDDYNSGKAERKICYEKISENISKWNPVVQKHKRARQLSFYQKQCPSYHNPSLTEISRKFTPATEFEKEYDKLIKNVGYDKTQSTETKDGPKSKKDMSKAELLSARSKQKSNAFFDTIRSKRIKKIKSKSYRRRLKAEKLREMAKLEKEGLMPKESKEEALLRRAEERMDLRHKTTGKWAKRVSKRPFLAKDKEIKGELTQMKRIETERLKKHDSEDTTDAEENQPLNDSKSLFDVPNADDKPKGIFSLSFMQRAAQRDLEETQSFLENKNEKSLHQRGSEQTPPLPQSTASLQKPAIPSEQGFETNFDRLNFVVSKEGVTAGFHEPKATEKTLRKKQVAFEEIPAENEGKVEWEKVLEKPEFDSDTESLPCSDSEGEIAQTGLNQKDFKRERLEAAKKAVAPSEDESSDSEAGWGKWTGPGLAKEEKKKRSAKEKRRKAELEMEAMAALKTQNPVAIINRQAITENLERLTIPAKPYNFATAEQYHRELERPIGPQWNARDDYRDRIQPRVLVRKGVPIEPIARGESLVRKF